LQIGKNINVLTADQLALGTLYLNASMPNPFYGVLPASTPRGSVSTVQRRVLLLPYPQFVNINMNAMSRGASWYNSLQLRVEKRFRDGFSALVTYTNSKTMQRTEYLNGQDAVPSRELASYDIPQRLVVSGIWDLPFGRRHSLLRSGPAARLAGGWQVSLISTSQSGTPIALPDYYLYGDPRLPPDQQTLAKWFDTSPQLRIQRPPDKLRTTKFRSPNMRRNTAPQVNTTLSRTFRVSERQQFQLKVSAFNIANTPIFGAPNNNPASPLFGQVPITQINLPRALELGFRYGF